MKGLAWRAVLVIAVTIGVLAVAWFHERAVGRRALETCDAALTSGDLRGAIEAAREAALSRTFRGTTARLGFERLDTIAQQAAARGDLFLMKAALIAMRSAADASDEREWMTRASDALTRGAGLIATSPSARALEGCSGDADATCLRAMGLELATETHPPTSSHAWLFGAAIALALAAIVATRRRSPVT